MKMTFQEYIQNPMGKNNSVFSQREMYRTLYTNKLDKIIVRENNKIDYHLYYGKDDTFYIHIKIPSETIEKFYYDVVIKFYTDDTSKKVSNSLTYYNVKFFSNDPSFVYTYAHTFIEKELFIEELKPKMSKLAIKKAAEIKNPNNVVGYVKSLFFAYLIMKNRGLFLKDKFKTYGQKFDKKYLLSQIEEADTKIKKRQEEEEKKKKGIKKKDKEKPPVRDERFTKSSITTTPSTKMINTKKSKTTKKTSFIKKK